jgi:beta-glucanase (GH16 family)
MKTGAVMMHALFSAILLICACGGDGSASGAGTSSAATPVIAVTAAQNGAVIVSISDATPGATIRYTLDGRQPSASSQIYEAPFLVAAILTVNAMATVAGGANSSVASKQFAPNIAADTLVWSEEFSAPGRPDPAVWTYDTGNSGFGNHEQETYCAWGSNTSPCSTESPNAYAGADGSLHIVARQPASGIYTSARLKSQGLFGFMYGRIEARIKVPESQGMWPAFWMLGNNIATIDWPACGELDIMEHIDGSNPPFSQGAAPPGFDWVQSSVHGTGLNGGTPYHPTGFSAADWHAYGMIWTRGRVQFYIDDPAHPYETFTPDTTNGTWPFDRGPQFILLNLAVGGDWPGNVDSTTVFPSEMLVDYVRIYTK